MVKGFDPHGERDLVFIPVGINYDRVLEDRTLLRKLDAQAPRADFCMRRRGLAAFRGRKPWLARPGAGTGSVTLA